MMNTFTLAAGLIICLVPVLLFFYLKRTCQSKRRKFTNDSFYETKHTVLALVLFYLITAVQAFFVTDIVSLIIYALLIFPILDNSLVTVMQIKILLVNWSRISDNPVQEHCGQLPRISFIIPSYEEPFDVKMMTLDSILNMDYAGPKEIISVDNSRDTQSERFTRWRETLLSLKATGTIDVQFLHNQSTKTLKPGNLDLALQHTTGEYVVFLDVDSTLQKKSDCLSAALRHFDEDPALGFVQFHVVPTNGHFNPFTAGVARYQYMHNATDIVGGMGGFTLFKGHNAIWRKSVLDEIGSWLEHLHGKVILVEDFLKTFQTYTSGYYGRILWIDTGEWIPSSLKAFTSMWDRWVYGSIQVIVKNIKALWHSPQFTVFEKIELFRRVRFGLYFLPYLAVVVSMLFPQMVAVPYLISLTLMELVRLYVCRTIDFNPTESDSSGDRYRSHYVGFMAATFVNWVGFTASVKFAAHSLAWFLRSPGEAPARTEGSARLPLTPKPEGTRGPQGGAIFWNVTEKGFESKSTIVNVFKENRLLYICHVALVLVCLWLLATATSGIWEVIIRLNGLFCFLNILLMPTLLGRVGRTQENDTSGATIDRVCRRPLRGVVGQASPYEVRAPGLAMTSAAPQSEVSNV